MKVSWKAIRVFGITIGIPLILFVADQARQARAATALRQKQQELADCKRCVTLCRVKAGLSFIEHLIRAPSLYRRRSVSDDGRCLGAIHPPDSGVAH